MRTTRSWIPTELALLVVVLIWGANYAVAKSAISEMRPMVFASLRFAAAALLTLLLCRAIEGRVLLQRSAWKWVAVLGFVGIFSTQALFINGLARTSASNTSLIQSTAPIFVTLMSVLLGTERIHRSNWMGILLAFVGVFLVVARPGSLISTGQTAKGDLMALGSTVAWASYTTLAKRLVQRESVLRATAWIEIAGAALLLIAAVPDLTAQDWQAISLRGWLGLAYSTLLASALGYTFWLVSVQRIGSARTSVHSYLQPLVTVTLSWALLGEVMTPLQAVGAAGILLGVALGRSRPSNQAST